MSRFDGIVAGFLGYALRGAGWAESALDNWAALAPFHEPTATERGLGRGVVPLVVRLDDS